jgi:hypothetical protein
LLISGSLSSFSGDSSALCKALSLECEKMRS